MKNILLFIIMISIVPCYGGRKKGRRYYRTNGTQHMRIRPKKNKKDQSNPISYESTCCEWIGGALIVGTCSVALTYLYTLGMSVDN